MRAAWDEAAELVAAAHVHTIRRYGPDRIAGFSPIPAMSMVSYTAGHPLPLADRRRLPLLLRLVRRPAAGLAADLGRPDRRARVGRLVELLLHDPLGLEHPADPDPRRPLHDRGPLQGPEGRRRLARLRRPHQVRRPLAARRGRHRRRPGDGDGPRDPEGVLRRPRGRRTSATTPAATPTCRCSSPCASARTAPASPTRSCAPPTSATSGENAEWKTVVYDARSGEPVVPNGSIGYRWGEEGAGQLEPRPRRDRPGADPARPPRRDWSR